MKNYPACKEYEESKVSNWFLEESEGKLTDVYFMHSK